MAVVFARRCNKTTIISIQNVNYKESQRSHPRVMQPSLGHFRRGATDIFGKVWMHAEQRHPCRR